MSNISQPERATQNRVLRLFTARLGYRPLGNWQTRENNSNIEERLLTEWLTENGHSPDHIRAALHKHLPNRSWRWSYQKGWELGIIKESS